MHGSFFPCAETGQVLKPSWNLKNDFARPGRFLVLQMILVIPNLKRESSRENLIPQVGEQRFRLEVGFPEYCLAFYVFA